MASKRTSLAVAVLAAVTVGCSGATTQHNARATSTARTGDRAGTTVEWPVTRCGTFSGKGCAPTRARVDLQRPRFTHPTRIDNPLFPISALHSVVLLGKVDGRPFRAETTLIPGRHTVIVDGRPIDVVVSQYTAFRDGRIDEVAIDRYAQADDGSVWYLGEDVFDYRNGTIAMTEGSWLAGRDGPPAMIMPAHPRVGDVFRAENVTGVVFEEITVKAIGQARRGPSGPVDGVAVMQELHLDGSVSNKLFAPGYGEFDTSSGGDTESLALAVSADAISGVAPPELKQLSTSAWGVLENARLDDWEAAVPTARRMTRLWNAMQARHYAPRLVHAMNDALPELVRAVSRHDAAATSQAAVDVAQSALDLELLYRGDVEIDRFHLHAQQLRVYATAKDSAGVASEVATLEWVRDRFAGSVSDTKLASIDTGLGSLRAASSVGNLRDAADIAARIAALLRSA